MKKSFVGGAVPNTLQIGIDEVALQITGLNFQGWPDGTEGPINVTLDRDKPTEEKILATSISGTTMVVAQRGYDSTTPRAHGAGATIEHGWFGVDASDTNRHTNASSSEHGLSTGDGSFVGTTKDQTLTNKHMDGAANDFTNIPPSAVPVTTAEILGLHNEDTNLQNQITAEVAARQAGDATVTTGYQNADSAHASATSNPHASAGLITKPTADTLYDPINAASTSMTNHLAAADPHPQYLTPAEANAAYAPLTDALPLPVSSTAANSTLTATAFAQLPNRVFQTMTFAHDCWVRISYGAWLAIADTAIGAEVRCGLRIDAVNPPQVAWGEVLEISNSAELLNMANQQRYGSVLKKVLAGSHTFELVAYKTAATNTGQVNYPFIEVLPVRWG